ncbi:hypothetical protein BU23DRAFT_602813 [Bimuria novae-zelandiae CBS 107.79]|uniref:Homeobox domain-containing protein n=1 Tax=Bimuria novae-zelandiae CBS 107.79 TaxID=1447943 RepID=A0A6A5URC2_9PLEO|nr:hypothetical protein BU23DRAFT_602813 [Bimuria novae-zelandiae CBS 107.79]
MDASNNEKRENSWNSITPHGADHAEAEQIDWNSFVNLEYDPTIPAASTTGPLEANEECHKHVSQSTGFSTFDPTLDMNNLSSFAALEFPSMDEWWAELPSNTDPGESEHWTTASLSQENTHCSDSASSAYADWQSPELEDEGGDRKRRRRLPPKAKRLLTDCFESHRGDPYIPKEELQELATNTGLSLRQVQTFFANARARKLPRPSTEGGAIDIAAPTNQQGPMERFLSSSPEDEGISEDVVGAAANQMKRPIKPARSRKGVASSVRSNSQSSASASSSASMDSLASRDSRKGRKRQRKSAHTAAKSIFRKPSSPSRKFQCTFCSLDFEQKYDWKRHEESVHFPQKEWVCMPNGPLENAQCVFCEKGNVNDEHLGSHKSIVCSEAPRAQRTFQRKDKLAQHIKQVHGCPPPKMAKEWYRRIERNVLMLCGFCSLELPDWKTRADHLSVHFVNGIEMTMWLPELIGGIWPNDELTRNYTHDKFSVSESPEGKISCEACPAKFLNLAQVTLHRRQAHSIYRTTDSHSVMARPGANQHSQRLINLAQQTSRIQTARVESDLGRTGKQSVSHHGPLATDPVSSRMVPRVDGSNAPPTSTYGIMPAITNRQLGEPERRGFSSQPHSVWPQVLHQGAVASPRTPMRTPLTQKPTTTTSRNQTISRTSLLGNSARGMGLSHVELANQAAISVTSSSAPPVEAIRAILTSSRNGVGAVGAPAQGMLHSLEQFEDRDRAWPRPPG